MSRGAILVLLCAMGCTGQATRGQGDTALEIPTEDTGSSADETLRLPLQLALPLVDRDRFDTLVGVDHDPKVQDDSLVGRATCLDYQGRSFPHCYDRHDGSDYILSGGFSTMDAFDTVVQAAAAGVVSGAEDGHYDRCHGDLSTGDVSCDGNDMVANSVIVEHMGTDGSTWRTLYWHLAKDSVAVSVGQQVKRGDLLGLVGSSGYSSMPHLHFELQQGPFADSEGGPLAGAVVDPYAGPYSQDQTAWCDQGQVDSLPGDCGDVTQAGRQLPPLLRASSTWPPK